MHVERLKLLSRLNRERDPATHDLGKWSNECGTVCCTAGFAATHVPEFQALGLHMAREYPCTAREYLLYRPMLKPAFEGETAYPALAAFFGITEDDVEWLFDPSRYRWWREAPATVSDRIDALVKEYEESCVSS